LKVQMCSEIRLRAEQKAYALKCHKATIQELEQRWRQRELVKEIKTRQKQIMWKKRSCTIIKQGGNKSRVNTEIQAIAKQKHNKKHINLFIRQGGLKSNVQREIRQIRSIMELKKQKTLKTKVNLAIRQIAKAHAAKRRVCMVLKQTGLKAKCNREIQHKEYYLWPVVCQHQVRSKFHNAEPCENEQLIEKQPEKKSPIFDDRDTVYGETVSKKGIVVMKLVDIVAEASKLKDQQDGEIRALAAVVTQQRADFALLNKRLVEDKNRLYQKLEDLKEENETLTELLSNQEREELVMILKKAKAGDIKRQKSYSQRQQVPQFYQEMEELSKSTPVSSKTQPSQYEEPARLTQIF